MTEFRRAMRPEITSPNQQYNQLPIADLRRRIGAAAIDFVIALGVSSIIASALGGGALGAWLFFLICWYVIRVLFVLNNQGQSPGHWALDMKVVQENSGRMPRQEWMLRREAAIGFVCSLLLISLQNQSYGILIFVLAIPVGFDGWCASTDRQLGQTLHDRWGRTVVINTVRGYSLDLKVQQWIADFQERSRRSRY